MRKTVFPAVAALILALPISTIANYAAGSLYVTVSVTLGSSALGETITVTGRVTDSSGLPVSHAAISIQVSNPYGSSVHVALTYSGLDGAYSDSFALPGGSPTGNYTVYVTASKTGYEDAHFQFPFLILTPDFAISVYPSSATVNQGELSSYTITLTSQASSSFPVSLSLIGLPKGASYSFSSDTAVPPASLTLTVITSSSTPVGLYNLTVIGSCRGKIRSEIVTLNVVSPRGQTYVLAASVLAAVGLITAILGLRYGIFQRLKRGRAEVEDLKTKLTPDKEYLAAVRALARIEELRAKGKISEEAYQKIKLEYEGKLEEILKKKR